MSYIYISFTRISSILNVAQCDLTELYLGECIQDGCRGGVTGHTVAANQTDTIHQNTAPSQELELNVQFNQCCVM